MTLSNFLKAKSLYYDKIDYAVIKHSWEILKEHINAPYVIHIIGTNGKGSTGRYLASFLHQSGKNVLHYSSPHVLKFNERIWINGKDSTDEQLNKAHEELQKILPQKYLERLTYFEYTTLLGLFLSSDMEYLVLEAGLGGEFDATNVIKNDLSILTSVGLDHQSFLGESIEEITLTKARSCDNTLIVSEQSNNDVYDILKENFKKVDMIMVKEQRIQFPKGFAYDLPSFLASNLKTVFCVLDHLKIDNKEFVLPKLKGRYEKISSNIILDVGHNPLAAKVIGQQLKKENKKRVLIYNSFEDKDYKEVLKILKPYIKNVMIIECDDYRIMDKRKLQEQLAELKITYSDFSKLKIKEDENYLVFGSFSVAESFLKETGFEK